MATPPDDDFALTVGDTARRLDLSTDGVKYHDDVLQPRLTPSGRRYSIKRVAAFAAERGKR